jgi:dephospho-CoA kinase
MQLLATLGAQTVDADALVRWAYNSDDFKTKLVTRFGRRALDSAGSVNRTALADIVFQDRRALADLERLVHPAVLDQVAGMIEAYRRDEERAPVLALEVQLLFETGAEAMVDKVLVVTAPEDVRRRRLCARGWGDQRIAAVENHQMPPHEKEARADYVLSAAASIEETAVEVGRLWREMLGD